MVAEQRVALQPRQDLGRVDLVTLLGPQRPLRRDAKLAVLELDDDASGLIDLLPPWPRTG
jgi:hypothetical protein